MSELHPVGYNFKIRKKSGRLIFDKSGLSSIIVILIIIALSMSAAFILYYSFRKVVSDDFGEKVSCFDNLAIVPSFYIKNSCYLNSGEILVDLERKSDTLELKNIKFAFFGENATRWMIRDNKKCSDARTLGTNYSSYCEILKQDSEINYVFNVSDLDKKNKVIFVITELKDGKEISCSVDSRDIKDSC